MRRHIVRTFRVVHPAGIRRSNALQRRHKVSLHVRIGVFLNDQRGRRVPQIGEQHAGACVNPLQEVRYLVRDLDKALAGRFDCQHRRRDELRGRALYIR